MTQVMRSFFAFAGTGAVGGGPRWDVGARFSAPCNRDRFAASTKFIGRTPVADIRHFGTAATSACPCCPPTLSRRQFLCTTAAGAVASSAIAGAAITGATVRSIKMRERRLRPVASPKIRSNLHSNKSRQDDAHFLPPTRGLGRAGFSRFEPVAGLSPQNGFPHLCGLVD